MDFITANWALILVALTSGGLLLWPAIQGASGGDLSVSAAVQMINREKAQLIDVGDAAEYAAGHPAGARNLPLADVQAKLPELVKNKNLPVVFVCRSGTRARRAQTIARQLGYDKAQAIAGGFAAWQEASLPAEKANA